MCPHDRVGVTPWSLFFWYLWDFPHNASFPVSYKGMDTNTIPQAPNTNAMDSAFGAESTMAPSGSTTLKVVDGELKAVNALGLESTLDHTRVSKIWQDKCITADKFRETLQEAETHKYDVTLVDEDVRLNADLTLVKPCNDMDGNPLETVGFTRHGLDTLIATAGIPRGVSDYLLSDDARFAHVADDRAANLAKLVNEDLDIRNDEWENPSANMKKTRRGVKENGTPDPRNFVLRLRNDENDKPVVRAVVSQRYTRELSNLQVFDLMGECFSDEDMKRILVSHLYHNGDDMIGNLLLPDSLQTVNNDSDYGIGVAFRNSEVKRYLWEIRPFAFRAICLNGCIWGRRDATYFISKKHLGNCDLVTLRAECERVMALALSHGQAFLDQMMLTKEVVVKDEARLFAQIASENAITRTQMGAIADAYQLSREAEWVGTGFGVIQAITAGAQAFDAGTRNNLESAAGDLISPSLDADLLTVQKFWERLGDRAERLSDDDVKWAKSLLNV